MSSEEACDSAKQQHQMLRSWSLPGFRSIHSATASTENLSWQFCFCNAAEPAAGVCLPVQSGFQSYGKLIDGESSEQQLKEWPAISAA